VEVLDDQHMMGLNAKNHKQTLTKANSWYDPAEQDAAPQHAGHSRESTFTTSALTHANAKTHTYKWKKQGSQQRFDSNGSVFVQRTWLTPQTAREVNYMKPIGRLKSKSLVFSSSSELEVKF
jgi:hypothetical protein